MPSEGCSDGICFAQTFNACSTFAQIRFGFALAAQLFGQDEHNAFFCALPFAYSFMPPPAYGCQYFLHQHFGRGRACRYADFVFALKPRALQVGRVVHHIRIGSDACRHFAQAVAVGRIRRTDHNHNVALFRQLFDGGLPVGRRIADVFLVRIADIGETLVQRGDDVFGFIDRERGLADIGEFVGVSDTSPTVSTKSILPGAS